MKQNPGRARRESAFKKTVDDYLKTLPNSHWFSIQQAAIYGTPDKIGVINGTFVGLELKADKNARRSMLQIYNLNRINKAQGYGRFVYPEVWDEIKGDLYYMAMAPEEPPSQQRQ